jgi:hypothetical protein
MSSTACRPTSAKWVDRPARNKQFSKSVSTHIFHVTLLPDEESVCMHDEAITNPLWLIDVYGKGSLTMASSRYLLVGHE